MLAGCLRHDVMPPDVALVVPVDVVAAALDDQHVLHRLLLTLPLRSLSAWSTAGLSADTLPAIPAVGGDHELGSGVVDARAQAVGAEAAEHHRVHRAEARHREHRMTASGIIGR